MKKILLLVGPSGSGKSTVEKLLCENGFSKVISHTTREMRIGEINGKDYFFITKEEFEKMKVNFIETVEFGGNYYGVHSNEILDNYHNDIVIVVEPDGAKQILNWGVNNNVKVITSYLDISTNNQFERMKSRGDDITAIQKRMAIDDIRDRAEDLKIDIKINTEILSPVGVVNTLLAFYSEVK